MSAQQQVVGVGGLALIFANFWLTDQRKTISAGTLNDHDSSAQTAAAHKQLKLIAAELLFVGVATLLAGLSSQAGNAMVAIVLALMILWAITHYAGGPTTGATPSK